jgi:glycosyltransferase involved in cell wall biosynthesis
MTAKQTKVVHLVATGDFAAAFRSISSTGSEFYGAQRRAVEACVARRNRVDDLIYVRYAGGAPADERLSCGVRYISLNKRWDLADQRAAARQIVDLQPSHVVLGYDSVEILQACVDAGISILPVYANSFHFASRGGSQLRDLARRAKHRWRLHRLGRLLGHLEWIANHNLPASRQLLDIGVKPGKVVPYEVPVTADPADFEPKTAIADRPTLDLVFVGTILESKGVFDTVRAVARLRNDIPSVKLRIIGSGENERLAATIRDCKVSDNVEVLGSVSHANVLKHMRAADMVIVPSRPDYLEGLPLTIFESLAVRTPVVCSDHPMFVGRLQDGVDCLMFKAADDAGIAQQVMRLKSDGKLYESLSSQSATTWRRIRCDALVDDVIDHWLGGKSEDVEWLRSYSLGSGRYEGRGAVG